MMHYQSWQSLLPGSIVDLIAPSARWINGDLNKIEAFIKEWGLIPRIPASLYGPDLLCANSDEQRLEQLRAALYAPDSAAVWCIRGGYGATRLLPGLLNLAPPATTKLFMGLSDITALHIFLQDKWQWQTLHAPSAGQIAEKMIAEEDIECLKRLILGNQKTIDIQLKPLNNLSHTLNAPVTGGNLSLVQASIGTAWQINPAGKILFLEEVQERAYRIDRILVQLSQAGLFAKVKAVIFGDFIGGLEPNGTTLIPQVIARFAHNQSIPVYQCSGIGHGNRNAPLPLGAHADILAQHNMLRIHLK